MASWEYSHKEFPTYTKVKEGETPSYEVLLANKEYQIREHWVRAMEVRLVKQQLGKCQKTEGVNAMVNCRRLAKLYLELLREYKDNYGNGNGLLG
ncbi:10770_t:CDS:2 [Acaulospora morrowiae]|uniref:10770_t:CDS:1 n=1 Tax=Acaulospora morrowiae TaxID=94023 RepID=A0A9N9GHW9_9GLOM|nr:10770_t:CDS:2 [Acaulospora morrowiae]